MSRGLGLLVLCRSPARSHSSGQHSLPHVVSSAAAKHICRAMNALLIIIYPHTGPRRQSRQRPSILPTGRQSSVTPPQNTRRGKGRGGKT